MHLDFAASIYYKAFEELRKRIWCKIMAFQFIQEFFNGFTILGENSSQTGLQGEAQKLDLESQSMFK